MVAPWNLMSCRVPTFMMKSSQDQRATMGYDEVKDHFYERQHSARGDVMVNKKKVLQDKSSEQARQQTRRIFLAGCAGLIFSPLVAAIGLKDTLPPNGVLLTYDILYKGEKVGEHQMRAVPEGELIRLEHRRRIDVKVLFITAFTERHQSTEWWTKNVMLRKLDAKSLINGKEVDMSGHSQPDGFVFVVDGKEHKVPANSVTLDSYWVGNAVKRTSVIDVANGKVLETTSEIFPNGNVELKAKDLNAKFTYQGDFMSRGELEQDGNTIIYLRTTGP